MLIMGQAIIIFVYDNYEKYSFLVMEEIRKEYFYVEHNIHYGDYKNRSTINIYSLLNIGYRLKFILKVQCSFFCTKLYQNLTN